MEPEQGSTDGFMPDIDLGKLSTDEERRKEKDLENIQQMIQENLGF